MQRPTAHPKPNTLARLGTATLLAALILVPTAVAADANLPLVGEFDWMSWGGAFVILGLFALGAWALPPVRKVMDRVPLLKGAMPPVVAVAALLVASMINPGGIIEFSSTDAGPASFTGGTTATAASGLSSAWSATLYEDSTDIIIQFHDAAVPATTINPTVYIYKTGSTDKELLEGTAKPIRSGTASSGSVTITSFDVMTHDCTVDLLADVSGYYELIVRNQFVCKTKNDEGNNDKSLGTLYLTKIGTPSLASTPASLTCASSTQCDYTLVFKNELADSGIMYPAVKFSTGGSAASLDAIASGSAGTCSIIEVSTTQYVAYTGSAEKVSSDWVTCQVKITNNGVTGGTFNLTADDLFQYAGASAWNTNPNVRGATATAATQVSFA